MLIVAGCPSSEDTQRRRAADLAVGAPDPQHPADALLFEPSGPGVLRYLGLDIDPPDPRPGTALTVTHYFAVQAAPVSDATVVVRAEAGRQVVARDDHPPLYGRLRTSAWRVGDVWADRHVVSIPDTAPVGDLTLYAGLDRQGVRWTAQTTPGKQDGQDRLRVFQTSLGRSRAASAAMTGGSDGLPLVEVPVAGGAIEPDGSLDEPAWAAAPVLTFADSLGRDVRIRYPTRLRLLYDDRYLYVGFEAVDADITERYARRDDPIYEHETVELFVMPDVTAPATGPYVELQASPGGVIFDASFDGPRRGMNKGYDADQTVGTVIDGTLNDPRPDRGWTSEWRVPFAALPGVNGPPAPGDEWRMNAFRIEKFVVAGKRGAEYSAWSPPNVGDFHHVARFGRLRFGGTKASP